MSGGMSGLDVCRDICVQMGVTNCCIKINVCLLCSKQKQKDK